MKITKLEQQKSRKNRASIYLDGVFHSGISANIILDCDLYVGKEVGAVDLEKILIADEYQATLARAYDLISRRLQSEKEIRAKLLRSANFHTVNKVIIRLRDLGYVDDVVFTKFWIDARKSSRGKRQLEQELSFKGIDKEIIKSGLEGIDKETELSVARALALKKKILNIPEENRYDIIGGFLARRGFGYDIIKQVINENKKSCE